MRDSRSPQLIQGSSLYNLPTYTACRFFQRTCAIFMRSRCLFFCSIITSVILGILPVFQQYLLQQLIDSVGLECELNQWTLSIDSDLLVLLLGYIGSFLGEILMGFFFNLIWSNLLTRSIVYLRKRLFVSTQNLPLSSPLLRNEEGINLRFTQDLVNVEKGMQLVLLNSIKSILQIIFALILIFHYHVWFGVCVVVIYLLTLGSSKLIYRYFLKRLNIRIEKDNTMSTFIAENIAHQSVLRAFSNQNYAIDSFKAMNGKCTKIYSSMHFWNITNQTFAFSLTQFFSVILLGYGFLLISEVSKISFGNPSLGELLAIYIIVEKGWISWNDLLELYSSACRVSINFAKIDQVICLGELYNLRQARRLKVLPTIKKEIVFDNVHLKYEDCDRYTLEAISLKIKKNSFVGIVGPNSAGKSTLVRLLIDEGTEYVEKGTIQIDNHNLSECSKESILFQIAVLFKDRILINGSIRENILFGYTPSDINASTAADDCMNTAAKLADIHDFILTLKDGYNTKIGEMGTVLSEGQVQRICLARALFRQPSILIMDDATSDLDLASASTIHNAILNLRKDPKIDITIISATYKLSETQDMDRIYVIDPACGVEEGTYTELTRGNPYSRFNVLLCQGKGSEYKNKNEKYTPRDCNRVPDSGTPVVIESSWKFNSQRSMYRSLPTHTPQKHGRESHIRGYSSNEFLNMSGIRSRTRTLGEHFLGTPKVRNRTKSSFWIQWEKQYLMEKELFSWIEIGSRVLAKAEAGDRLGEVKFKGKTDFAEGLWIGMELDDPIGKHNGTVGGKSYFTAQPKHGIFLRPENIVCMDRNVLDTENKNDSAIENDNSLKIIAPSVSTFDALRKLMGDGFSGEALVSMLVEKGMATNRSDAVAQGQSFLTSGTIRAADSQMHLFEDNSHIFFCIEQELKQSSPALR